MRILLTRTIMALLALLVTGFSAADEIRYSLSPDRSEASTLDGARGFTGNIYVFFDATSTIDRVAFSLDSGAWEEPDTEAPYDFKGTDDTSGNALPFDTTTLSIGSHSIIARVYTSEDDYEDYSAGFNILGEVEFTVLSDSHICEPDIFIGDHCKYMSQHERRIRRLRYEGDNLPDDSQFVVSLGDHIEWLARTAARKYIDSVNGSFPAGKDHYMVLGNHDIRYYLPFQWYITPEKAKRYFREEAYGVIKLIETDGWDAPGEMGVKQGWNFLGMHSGEAANSKDKGSCVLFGDDQLARLDEQLAGLTSKTAVLFWHVNPYKELTPEVDTKCDEEGWTDRAYINLLKTHKNKIKAVFSGHSHNFYRYSWDPDTGVFFNINDPLGADGIEFYVVGSTGQPSGDYQDLSMHVRLGPDGSLSITNEDTIIWKEIDATETMTTADLRVFKDCKPDRPMLVGDTATCTITVQNLGPDPSYSVTAIDEYVSDGIFELGEVTTTSGTCYTTDNPQAGAGTVDCDLGTILRNTSVTIKIPVTADEPQDINDRVTVFSLHTIGYEESGWIDLDQNNNVAEDTVTVIEIADLQVFKDCKPDDPLLAGEPGTCTITVKNWGPSTARNMTLHDALLSNGTFNISAITPGCTATPNPQEGSGDVNCALGDLAPDAEATVAVELLANTRQNINDTAIASSDVYDPDNTNNSAKDGIGVTPVADLALTKTAPSEPVIAGTQFTYDLEVTNSGPSTAANVLIEDVLPAGVTIDSVNSSAGSCNAGVPGEGSQPTTCTFDSLAVGDSAIMQIVVTVEPQILGIISNNAEVHSDMFDRNNSNNLATTATKVTANADLTVAKSDNPDPVLAGENLTYDVTIGNTGPSTAVDVMLTDTLPDEVSYVGYTISNGSGTCAPLEGSINVECDLNDLNPGEFVTVYIQVQVDPSVYDGTTIINTAAVSSATIDPDGANDIASEDTMVYAKADLTISKDSNFLADNPSKQIVYTLLVTNTGPSDALDVEVIDHLPLDPKKIIYVMDSGNSACYYDKGLHELICDFGTLPAKESVTVDIIVDAKGGVRQITNIADVSTSTTDPDLSNNEARKEINIKGGSQTK